MKTNELRIGNYVKCSYSPAIVKVVSLNNYSIDGKTPKGRIYSNKDDFEPIELTEEVLLKIWFKKIDNGIFRRKIGFYTLIFNGVKLNIFDGFTGVLEMKCEYLHQLQNAYYLLTNQELKIEL